MNLIKKIKYIYLISVALFMSSNYLWGSSVKIKYTMNQVMQEKILKSPLKALLHRNDGKKIIAYLYADDEKTKETECNARMDGSSYTTTSKKGHFKIYLYDIELGIFLPIITPIFKYLDETTFNVEGAKLMVLPSHNKGLSDVLLVSQFATFEGDVFQAYGFSQDNLSFKQYMFRNMKTKKEEDEFYGSIGEDTRKKKLIAYATLQAEMGGGVQILTMDISVSKTLGKVELTDAESEKK